LDFVWNNPGEPVPAETFTHSHLSWSSIVPYLFDPSNTIRGILPVQSTCLTVFFHDFNKNRREETYDGRVVALLK